MNDEVLEEFTRGVNDYWGGECPEGWNNETLRNDCPYLMGWYMASLWEVYPGELCYEDGTPMQEDD